MIYQAGEYTDEVFRSIPYARDAFPHVDENPLSEAAVDQLRYVILDTTIAACVVSLTHSRSVFLRHGVADFLGLSILHRHFDMQPNERLVECQAVVTAWLIPDCLPVVHGEIAAKNWAFINGQLHPYEFRYVASKAVPSGQLTSEFVCDLREALVRHRLEKTYGVGLLPENAQDESQPAWLEFTAGKASVSVPMTAGITESLTSQTMFLFPCIDP